ncbi:peptidylprolyl isomerase [Peptoniphilus sp. MSJ-1]|uniref:Peptidylprolyl isomerase n=1 Tax=Peptoniphilus ovalis TaxID=2841503 RepID=A0ABS6FDK7_9FIRM|nr:peptidylprolyl isomerase [Peptoniphilus ovalis]MBU5668260.1 peptidylprolyl isomerase [Peptoniphilus ovalis]
MFFKKLGTIALSAVLISSLAGCGKKEGVAAEVNGVEIPIESFYKSYSASANQLVAQYGEDYLAEKEPTTQKTYKQLLGENALRDLTQIEMVKQDAEKSKITVSDEEVNKQLEAIKAQLGGQEAFNAFLKDNGLEEEFVVNNLKNQMLLSKYVETKQKELEPTEDEVKKYYEDNKDKFYTAKASHILVDNLKEANVIRKEIQKGGDFAEIAKEKSKDTGSAQNGGSLGEFKNGQMVPQFDEAIQKMKVGEISEPIQSQFGYHVIKLEEKKPAEFDAVKDQIKATLQQEKFQKYMEDLTKKSKTKNYVDPSKDFEVPEEYKNYGKSKQQEAQKESNTAVKEAEQQTNKAANKATEEVKETAEKAK